MEEDDFPLTYGLGQRKDIGPGGAGEKPGQMRPVLIRKADVSEMPLFLVGVPGRVGTRL